jgi:Cilia- and flagella-associated protein 91
MPQHARTPGGDNPIHVQVHVDFPQVNPLDVAPTPHTDLGADTVYTVSSAADHFREQTRRGGFALERAPDFANFTSALHHYPATTFRLKNDDKVPHFVPREYAGAQSDPAERCRGSLRAAVTGAQRYKHSHRPFLASNAPIIIIRAPKPQPPDADAAAAPAAPPPPASRTVGTQSAFSESEAQTDPYSPDAAPPAATPALKQALHSALHHCGTASELSTLAGLRFALGQRPNGAEVAAIMRGRARRALEASLPPPTDAAALPARQKLLEEWEQRECASPTCHDMLGHAAGARNLCLLKDGPL